MTASISSYKSKEPSTCRRLALIFAHQRSVYITTNRAVGLMRCHDDATKQRDTLALCCAHVHDRKCLTDSAAAESSQGRRDNKEPRSQCVIRRPCVEDFVDKVEQLQASTETYIGSRQRFGNFYRQAVV